MCRLYHGIFFSIRRGNVHDSTAVLLDGIVAVATGGVAFGVVEDERVIARKAIAEGLFFAITTMCLGTPFSSCGGKAPTSRVTIPDSPHLGVASSSTLRCPRMAASTKALFSTGWGYLRTLPYTLLCLKGGLSEPRSPTSANTTPTERRLSIFFSKSWLCKTHEKRPLLPRKGLWEVLLAFWGGVPPRKKENGHKRSAPSCRFPSPTPGIFSAVACEVYGDVLAWFKPEQLLK